MYITIYYNHLGMVNLMCIYTKTINQLDWLVLEFCEDGLKTMDIRLYFLQIVEWPAEKKLVDRTLLTL